MLVSDVGRVVIACTTYYVKFLLVVLVPGAAKTVTLPCAVPKPIETELMSI